MVRIEKNDAVTVLADKFEGKRLNSPNDAVYKSDGALYFTDPPYGFPKEDDDPKKELKFNGVYRLQDGKLQLLTKELTRPNGLAFSPDEKFLYVANSDAKRKIWMRYDVEADGSIKNGKVFYDVTAQNEDGLPDGMKVDTHGNIYATGPGASGSSPPRGSIWAPSNRRRPRPIYIGERTPPRWIRRPWVPGNTPQLCTSPHARASTGSR